ncbi:MAG: transferase [Candidatus Riflebacteria bacterium]|nr:transferase [Candidatus Riflebacteria bacterium]
MKSRYLVTTADERTWPTGKPILFLGEWCRLYNRKIAWEKLDAKILPYHWDDRSKLYRDYQYLRVLYEKLLAELSIILNELHGVDNSSRYWRILIGPWLGFFTQMLFDRWEMINSAQTKVDILGVRILDTPLNQTVPLDMTDFNKLYLDDFWNEAIFAQILRAYPNIHIDIVRVHISENLTKKHSFIPASEPQSWKRIFMRTLNLFLQKLYFDNEAFFITTYLPLKSSLMLQWKFGQIPKIWHTFPSSRTSLDESTRNWSFKVLPKNSFETILYKMIPKHIPILYLEGYSNLQKQVAELPWPKKPKLIFTSNLYCSDDVFKAWSASKVEKGSTFVIGQHGGGHGIHKWGFLEDHQMAISDSWLSWGWDSPNNSKIIPFGNVKIVNHFQEYDSKGKALLIQMSLPRYSYHMYSIPTSSQWLAYFEDQYKFITELPEEIRKQLVVRTYSQDYGRCQKQLWLERFPDIQIDDGIIPINYLIKKSRIYISTYNSSTFLESLGMNIPTIIFWNPSHWELSDNAIPFFNHLKEVGIFHETPQSAAAKLSEIWNNVDNWWFQKKIQDVRQYFCHQFSRVLRNPINTLKNILLSTEKDRFHRKV